MRVPSPARLVAWSRPLGPRQVRLVSGLVLFTYITLHLTNHALGNISLEAMERALLVQKFIWQGWIGSVALYAALAAHFVLGLHALYERRRLHWTPAEVTQLLLGLAVPPLLANHLAVTRVAFTAFGLNKGYAQELYSFWIASPTLGWVQLTLLVVAWLHGCLGITFWLRLKPWFPPLRPVLLAIAVLLPVLALLGYLQAGRTVVALAQDPVWRAAAIAVEKTGTAQQVRWLADLRNGFLLFVVGALALIVLARLVRGALDRRRGRVCVSYPDGRRQFVPRGFSVLEASLLAGIPHAALCGGRARCSLCRVRVLGTPEMPPPEEAERRVLARLQADPAQVRLACQLHPTRDIAVLPLVPPDAQLAFLHRRQERAVAREQFVAILVADMRGSTQLAAGRLPYDSVFILGRFVSAVSAGTVEAGGVPNQFLGDSVLAIFGLNCDPPTACRQAFAAAGLVARNIRQLNTALADELPEGIEFGIGVHCGNAVVGEIGFRDHVVSTALGDVPNVASRLENLTRELGCEAVVSEDLLRLGGIRGDGLAPHLARLRGRDEPVAVRLLRDPAQEAPVALRDTAALGDAATQPDAATMRDPKVSRV
jgi:adenylate cyclase